MRTAMIGPFGLRPKGTVARRALPMAKALAAEGHQVDVILPPWNYPQDSGREWKEDGVIICNIALPPHLPLIWHLAITWRLVRRALAADPDVVHCFKPMGYSGFAAMALWFLKKLGLTRARLVVDSDDWEGKGGWSDVRGYTWAQRHLFIWQERWCLTHCDAVTVASRALETIVWSLGVKPGRVSYVPNGVATSDEQQARHSRPSPAHRLPTVLLYTRFFEYDLERVVDIFRRVLAEVPEAQLLVVGKGLFGEEEELLAMMRDAGLIDRIVYAGWAEPDELPAYLAAADVAIYPYDDTLINRAKCSAKLIQLMAAGLPVVADDVGQNGEYIEYGTSGLLVPPGDREAFARSIVELLRDESLRKRLGQGARRRILKEFDWEKLVVGVRRAYGT
ncbi:MAG: glycosyltransferase family 4 protein [Chloroflexota bacterium]|nr:glycosyltransferase family 4 protein [Chloroflexota bacterium]